MGGVSPTIVGVAGQWASGKSAAAKTLVDHLGGQEQVIFLSDRPLVGTYALNTIRQLDQTQLRCTVDPDGYERLDGPSVAVILRPGETLNSVDPNLVLFDLQHDLYDNVPAGELSFFDTVRLELGRQICDSLAEGRPVVVEAGFGSNLAPRGENPFSHSLFDLFVRLGESGLTPGLVKWIVIEASYEVRAERNRQRADRVPAHEFDRFAADGGDLDPDQQRLLERQGTTIIRVANEHNSLRRFKADIIAAYEGLFAIA